MKLTLKDGGHCPEQIDHINAHGTGTHMNDSCETAAIHAVFGDHAKDIAVVSTKSMTGHLLGGAGSSIIIMECRSMHWIRRCSVSLNIVPCNRCIPFPWI